MREVGFIGRLQSMNTLTVDKKLTVYISVEAMTKAIKAKVAIAA